MPPSIDLDLILNLDNIFEASKILSKFKIKSRSIEGGIEMVKEILSD